MADLGLDATQETRITVMQLKIERLEEKQEELRERLKVVEKWVIGAAAVALFDALPNPVLGPLS